MTEPMSPLLLALQAEGVDAAAAQRNWALEDSQDRTVRLLRESDRVVVGVRAAISVGVQTLAEFDNWLPLLPLAGSDEAVAVAELVAAGTLGAMTELDITVGYGADRWDPQPTAPYPQSALEASAWGLHLLERLAWGPVDLADWIQLSGPGPARLGLGRLVDGVPVRLRVLPAERMPGPCWSAQVWFTDGHASARTPLAPGRVTTWDSRRQELLSSNGRSIGKGAGNDALDGSALRDLVRWACQGGAAPGDGDVARHREEALSALAGVERRCSG